MAGRFYRIATGRAVRHVAAACVIVGWSVVLLGATWNVPTDTETHLEFVIWLGGAVLVLIGCTAGFTAWFLNPAIERRFVKHILDGVNEHRDLVAARDYQTKHDELVREVSTISGQIAMLIEHFGISKQRGKG